MPTNLAQQPISQGPWKTGQGSDKIVPKRSDLNTMWQYLFNMQGNGINITYTGKGGGVGEIVFTVPEQLDSPGPFFIEAQSRSYQDDRIVIGGCVNAYNSFAGDDPPGRDSTGPGVLMVDSKLKLFNAPEYIDISDVVFGAIAEGSTVTKLLTLWVDTTETPAADYSDRAVFYDYAFIAKEDLGDYPDWKKEGKTYFPLGWVTVRNNTDDLADSFKHIIAISWPNTNWILQGGSSLTEPTNYLIRITGVHPDSPTTGIQMYTGRYYPGGYANGSHGTCTISIPEIAADVTTPASGAWGYIPPCMGIGNTITWVGATETHTEMVYEAVGLMLLV